MHAPNRPVSRPFDVCTRLCNQEANRSGRGVGGGVLTSLIRKSCKLHVLPGSRHPIEDVIQSATFSPYVKEVLALRRVGASFSPDGNRLTVIDSKPDTKIRDATGRVTSTVVYGGAGDSIKIRDATSGRVSSILRAGRGGLITGPVSFSPDGEKLSAIATDRGARDTIRTWDALTGRTVATRLPSSKNHFLGAVFSPDRRHLLTLGMCCAAGSDKAPARIWDVASGHSRRLAGTPGRFESIEAGSFSADGKRLILIGIDGTVGIWDAKSARMIGVLLAVLESNRRDGLSAMASFSPNGRQILTAGNDDGSAAIWDIASGRRVEQFKDETGHIRQASFAPDGARALTVSKDSVQIWAVANGATVPSRSTANGHPRRTSRPAEQTTFSYDVDRIIRTLPRPLAEPDSCSPSAREA